MSRDLVRKIDSLRRNLRTIEIEFRRKRSQPGADLQALHSEEQCQTDMVNEDIREVETEIILREARQLVIDDNHYFRSTTTISPASDGQRLLSLPFLEASSR